MPGSVLILGTRGIPAAHGGFETFAERLSLYLVARGWRVTVYCQQEGNDPGGTYSDVPVIDEWRGIRRVTISSRLKDGFGTVAFDWACVKHAMSQPGMPLVLGYNTALFALLLRIRGRPLLMNMDGIEWKREKWGPLQKAWLYANERIGAKFSTKLIADHPAIADHLATRRSRNDIVTIPYGADPIDQAPVAPVEALGLRPGRYLLMVGRLEPENSVLLIINAYLSRKRDVALVCLGRLDCDRNSYHSTIHKAANGKVLFPGAIYESERINALRVHALAYCHGHKVGGTNPSLVEALGAGNAIVAHDNRFNRWVAGEGQLYFSDEASCARAFDRIENDENWVSQARRNARARFEEKFRWDEILSQYEVLCGNFQLNASNAVLSNTFGTAGSNDDAD